MLTWAAVRWSTAARQSFLATLVGLVAVLFVAQEFSLYRLAVWGLHTSDIMRRICEREAKKRGLPFDTRTRTDIAKDIESSGKKAVPFIPSHGWGVSLLRTPEGQRYQNIGSISYAPTVLCNETEVDKPQWAQYLKPEFRIDLPRYQKTIEAALEAQGARTIVNYKEKTLRQHLSQEHARFSLFDLLTLLPLRSALGFRPYELWNGQPQMVALTKTILQQAKAHVEKRGGKLYFVYLPAAETVFPKGLAEYFPTPPAWIGEGVRKSVVELGIPLIDLLPVLQKEKPDTVYPFAAPAHLSAEGNAIAAREILKALESHVN